MRTSNKDKLNSLTWIKYGVFSLDINRENTKLITENETSRYILGIGNTDYTIHRDANDIQKYYKDEYGLYKDWKITDIHSHHVFTDILSRMLSDGIIWKDEFEYNGNVLKINRAYIGVYGVTEVVRIDRHLMYIGENIRDVNEKLKYIIEVEQL